MKHSNKVDKRFHYTPAIETDIGKRFKAEQKRLKEEALKPSNVTKLKRKAT